MVIFENFLSNLVFCCKKAIFSRPVTPGKAEKWFKTRKNARNSSRASVLFYSNSGLIFVFVVFIVFIVFIFVVFFLVVFLEVVGIDV